MVGLTYDWAVVVAQLVERSLPIPEVRGLNPVISKNLFFYIELLFTVNCVLKKAKIKKKEAENGPFKNVFKQIQSHLDKEEND